MPTFNPRRIVFAVYKGVSLLDLAGPLEAFRVADAFSPSRNGRSMYECTVVSSRGGRVMTADGVELGTKPTRSLTKKAIDTVVVPGGFQVDDVTRDRALVQWIRNIAPGCKRVCSVCVGSFLLAEAGILDSRRAATPLVACVPSCQPLPGGESGTGFHFRSRWPGVEFSRRNFGH